VKKFKNAVFIFAGDGNLMTRCTERARELGVKENAGSWVTFRSPRRRTFFALYPPFFSKMTRLSFLTVFLGF